MTTQSSDEKARRQAAQLQKRRQALMEAMRRDVQQLRKIIRGKNDKK
jgi:cytochrome c556